MDGDPFAVILVATLVALLVAGACIAVAESLRGRPRPARDVIEGCWFALIDFLVAQARELRRDYRRLVTGRQRLRSERSVVDRIKDYGL